MTSLRTRPGIATASVASAVLNPDCFIRYSVRCVGILPPQNRLVFATPKLDNDDVYCDRDGLILRLISAPTATPVIFC